MSGGRVRAPGAGGPGEVRRALLAEGTARLAAAGVAGAERDARRLLAWAAGLPPARLQGALASPAAPPETRRFLSAIAARAGRRPVSQILGERLFWGRRFAVSPEALDPRPETETLVAAALERPFARVLDLGTGTGCLLLTLLAERAEAQGLGTDISGPALALAAKNARALGLAARAAFLRTDWTAGIPASAAADLVVSNPPYLAEREIAGLAPELAAHEPRAALTPGGDGLAAYAAIAAGLGRILLPGGRAILEVGPGQAEPVGALLAGAGLRPAAPLPDLDGRARAVLAYRPPA